MADTYQMAAAFGRYLRAFGAEADPDSLSSFVRSLDLIGMGSRPLVHDAARATLIKRVEDTPRFERAFSAFFENTWPGSGSEEEPRTKETLYIDIGEEGDKDRGGESEPDDGEKRVLRFSAREVLSRKDFAKCTRVELDQLYQLIDLMHLRGSPKSSRRMIRSRRPESIDMKRTVAKAIERYGEPIERAYRRRGTQLRRVVFVLDVSGSMEPYARALLRFAHASVVARHKVEVFTFGTRLTRVTRELAWRDPDRALTELSARVSDYAGGTRLGATLGEFNGGYGVRGMARGADVVILSDGWDRGDPLELGREMERLSRVARRIIWVNPLKAHEGYAPLARGMAAALPHVDLFVEGHSLDALRRLAAVLEMA